MLTIEKDFLEEIRNNFNDFFAKESLQISNNAIYLAWCYDIKLDSNIKKYILIFKFFKVGLKLPENLKKDFVKYMKKYFHLNLKEYSSESDLSDFTMQAEASHNKILVLYSLLKMLK